MIVPIGINTEDIIEQFASITPRQINEMMDSIAKGLAVGFYSQWEKEAESALHRTRGRYIRNLRLVDSGKLEGTVLLDFSKDPLVRMIEQGASAFDMKSFMLRSSKAKTDKHGNRYITIPFRWATPDVLGESEVFSGKMPEEVYDLVKKKPTTIPVKGGGMRSQGLTTGDIATLPKPMQSGGIRAAITDSQGQTQFKAYQRKSSLYQGMIKQQDAVTGQSRYNTFRRISENSDADAFIHPGIQNYNLMQRALGNFDIPNEVGNLIDNELTRMGFME